jgi:hypothetical protein
MTDTASSNEVGNLVPSLELLDLIILLVWRRHTT